jgi:hypothetical protein
MLDAIVHTLHVILAGAWLGGHDASRGIPDPRSRPPASSGAAGGRQCRQLVEPDAQARTGRLPRHLRALQGVHRDVGRGAVGPSLPVNLGVGPGAHGRALRAARLHATGRLAREGGPTHSQHPALSRPFALLPCPRYTASPTSGHLQGDPLLRMAPRIVSSLRMQAVSATFFGLSGATKRP